MKIKRASYQGQKEGKADERGEEGKEAWLLEVDIRYALRVKKECCDSGLRCKKDDLEG